MYMHLFGMGKPTMFALPCMCASFRRASRTLTQHYDTAFRPLGLSATPFTLLQALSKAGEVYQSTLGEILTIDCTTLPARSQSWGAEAGSPVDPARTAGNGGTL